MKHILILLAALALLSSCAARRPATPMIRTTTYGQGLFGASMGQTVTETPYESPAYTAAGTALFSRP